MGDHTVAVLKQVEGFEDFDPYKEVLHCDKPGTGLIDAPRAFRIQLGRELAKLGLKATSVDNELFLLHDSKQSHLTYKTAASLGRRNEGMCPPFDSKPGFRDREAPETPEKTPWKT